MSLEDQIKNLAPELREKVRACTSSEEVLALVKEAKIPLPDEALEAIAGGDQPNPENCHPHKNCPKCGSSNTVCTEDDWYIWAWDFHCNDCGHNWTVDLGD